MQDIFLVVGLGNPGTKFKNTPHNIGFEILDLFKKEENFPAWQLKPKLKAEISKNKGDEKEVILAKPQTFMNRSGESVGALKNFYKIPLKNIWVVHDDLDMETGKMRIKKSSSSGGHKGVESVISALGSKKFNRIKIGIWNSAKDKNETDTKSFVLQKFSNEQKGAIKEAEQKAVYFLKTLLLKDEKLFFQR